jgi:hypothetical protein
MKMKSAKLGKSISLAEVTNVSKHGFWLLVGDKERFVAFEQFPWFRDAPIGHLLNVELPGSHHLYWPDLDGNIAIDSIDHPERFPLVSKVRANPRLQRPRGQAPRR